MVAGRMQICFIEMPGYFALRRDVGFPQKKRDVSPCGASYFALSGKVTKTLPGPLRSGTPALRGCVDGCLCRHTKRLSFSIDE